LNTELSQKEDSESEEDDDVTMAELEAIAKSASVPLDLYLCFELVQAQTGLEYAKKHCKGDNESDLIALAMVAALCK
jgi:hypothetical protein